MIFTEEDLEITKNVEEYINKQKEEGGVFWNLSIWHEEYGAVNFDEIDDLGVLKTLRKYFIKNTYMIVKHHIDIKGKVYCTDGKDYYSFDWTNFGQITEEDMKKLIDKMEEIINEKELQQR